MLLFRLLWPSQIPVSPPIPIIRLNHWGGVCAPTRTFVGVYVCVCVLVQIWQDDLIHQGLPLLVLGGTKNNLAKRDIHIHMHSRTQLASYPKARQLAWSSWTMSLLTHTHTHTCVWTQMQDHTPISLNLASCLCFRTSSVSPPPGCGVHSEAICLISPILFSVFVHQPLFYFLSLACTCIISSLTHFHSFFPRRSHT